MTSPRMLRGLVLAAIAALAAAGLALGPAPAADAAGAIEYLEPNEACTSILVGKAASADGSVMTTHTCDCGVCDWTWRHVPAADHKPGTMLKLFHVSQYRTWPPSEGLKWDLAKKDLAGVEIPQVGHTYAYHHAMFGYLNEKQVAIGEATIGVPRKLVNSTPTPGFDITTLTLMAMERAATAREAIQVMGGLAEKYGYGYHDAGEMLAVADPNEVWMFEIMPVGPLWTPQSGQPGAVWCAQRVPDDHVSVCPNESRIGEIDLGNKDFFMASEHVVTFAVEQGLYDPKSGKPFSWKRAYAPVEASAESSNGRNQRVWRVLSLAAPSLNLSPATPNMDLPFSVKPDKKVSVEDVMAWTRDRSYGTPFDPVQGIRGGPFKNPNLYRGTRVVDNALAEYTSITQSRGWLPDPIGGIVWIAFGSQDTSCFMPFYAGATALPKSFQLGDHWTLDRSVARWAFDYTDFHVQPVYGEAIEDVKAAQAKYESAIVKQIPEIDAKAVELYKKRPAEAAKFLTGFGLNNAQTVIDAWWKLGDDLLVKYNRLYLYNVEKRTMERGRPAQPELWRRAVRSIDAWVEPERPAAGRPGRG